MIEGKPSTCLLVQDLGRSIICLIGHFWMAGNVEAQVVGRVEPSDTKELIIQSEYGVFEY